MKKYALLSLLSGIATVFGLSIGNAQAVLPNSQINTAITQNTNENVMFLETANSNPLVQDSINAHYSHRSHVSHGSHSSHTSHYSSRF